jgi:methylaspartate mutase sigma subunit
MGPDQSLYIVRKNPLAIVVSGLSSDAHTWNLVYIQLVLEELGHRVTNLGACVPDQDLVAHCRTAQPDLIVLSSVNGHGFQDGMRVISALREYPALIATPVVIGGKLDTVGGDPTMADQLLAAGFDAIFPEDGDGKDVMLSAFRSFVAFVAESPAPAGASVTSPVGA